MAPTLTHCVSFAAPQGGRGWLQTVRGQGGGMRLAAAPVDINLGAVVRSIEPDFYLVDCLTRYTACSLTGHCKLTGIMSGALQSLMQYLDKYTLVDLLPPTAPIAADDNRPLQPPKGPFQRIMVASARPTTF